LFLFLFFFFKKGKEVERASISFEQILNDTYLFLGPSPGPPVTGKKRAKNPVPAGQKSGKTPVMQRSAIFLPRVSTSFFEAFFTGC